MQSQTLPFSSDLEQFASICALDSCEQSCRLDFAPVTVTTNDSTDKDMFMNGLLGLDEACPNNIKVADSIADDGTSRMMSVTDNTPYDYKSDAPIESGEMTLPSVSSGSAVAMKNTRRMVARGRCCALPKTNDLGHLKPLFNGKYVLYHRPLIHLIT